MPRRGLHLLEQHFSNIRELEAALVRGVYYRCVPKVQRFRLPSLRSPVSWLSVIEHGFSRPT